MKNLQKAKEEEHKQEAGAVYRLLLLLLAMLSIVTFLTAYLMDGIS